MITIEELIGIIQKLLVVGFETNTGRLRLFQTPAIGLARRGPENAS
jgi:hypothetical protein